MPTPCIVQHRYRVDPLDRDRLLVLLAEVRDHATELGVAAFEAWQDQDDPWLWSEVHRFDSWGHFQRLTQKNLDPHMQQTYEALARLQVGGADAVETRIWSLALANE